MGGPFRNYCVEKSKKGKCGYFAYTRESHVNSGYKHDTFYDLLHIWYITAVTSFVTGVFSRL